MIPNITIKLQSSCHIDREIFHEIRALFITSPASILLLGMSLLLTSCRQNSTLDTAPVRQFAEKSLKISLHPSSVDPKMIQEVATAWSRRTGAKVTFLTNEESEADIVIFSAKDLPQFAAQDLLRKVPNDIQGLSQAFHWEELLGVYPNKLLLWGDTPFAVPVFGEGRVFAYRLDFFDGKQGRPQAPPKTWEEVIRIAQILGPNCLPALGSEATDLETEWLSIAASYDAESIARLPSSRLDDSFFNFLFDAKTGQVRLNSPAFVDALKTLQALQPYRSQESAVASFSKGVAKMGAITLQQLRQIDPAIRAQLGFVCLPGTSYYYASNGVKENAPSGRNLIPYQGWGAVVGGVTKKCESPEAAWDLLYEFCHPERATFQIIASGLWGAGPIRLSHLQRTEQSDPIVLWQGYQLEQGSTFMLLDSLRQHEAPTTINGRTALRTANRQQLIQALDQQIRPVVQGGKDPLAAIQQLEADWKNQIDKFPNWREHYRLGLGL
ncbi:MAG: extracellular solute-binding protein [Gemmataceae bacterium]|jgi:ABC-type glycerol-3-phosphate transport system substrate-binding protein|nr:extracellular solute-binding protein [Gemmataceae bacterium]